MRCSTATSGIRLLIGEGPERAIDARIVKRSLSIAGHATSVSLEEPFWLALRQIADRDGESIASLVGRIDGERKGVGLSSALRLYVLRDAQARAG